MQIGGVVAALQLVGGNIGGVAAHSAAEKQSGPRADRGTLARLSRRGTDDRTRCGADGGRHGRRANRRVGSGLASGRGDRQRILLARDVVDPELVEGFLLSAETSTVGPVGRVARTCRNKLAASGSKKIRFSMMNIRYGLLGQLGPGHRIRICLRHHPQPSLAAISHVRVVTRRFGAIKPECRW